MRQYEKKDCVEEAKKNQKLGIGRSCISIPTYGEVDYVVVFGNDQTNKIVFVPFGSKIKIEDEEYKIIEGEKYAGKRYCKTQEYTLPWYRLNPKVSYGEYDHSSKCLLDKDKKLHDLEDFIGKEAIFLGRNLLRFCGRLN
jgi:hypothetical protein